MDGEHDFRPCASHPEFVKATTELMNAVSVLSNNVKWIVAIGKGLFAIGLALLVTVIFAIFYAGTMAERIDILNSTVISMKKEMDDHIHGHVHPE
jgi:uncharacterized membrane protein YGL010W